MQGLVGNRTDRVAWLSPGTFNATDLSIIFAVEWKLLSHNLFKLKDLLVY